MSAININNNIKVSGHYKLLWFNQSESLNNFKAFMCKLGLDEKLMWKNMENTHVIIEDSVHRMIFKFGESFSKILCTEIVVFGKLTEEPSFSRKGQYKSVWYRCGNTIVKQAKPVNKMDKPYSITREFLGNSMIVKFSTDNNQSKVSIEKFFINTMMIIS